MKQTQSTTATDNETRIEIGPGDDVAIFTDEYVQKQPAKGDGVSFGTADDGHLIIYTNGTVTTVPADLPAKPGQQMEDGTFYLGRFVDEHSTQRDYFVAAEDIKDKKGNWLLLDFRQAAQQAKKSKAHGYKDWTVPSARILNEIFENKADIEGLNLSGVDPSGHYRSSTQSDEYPGYTKVQRFADGARFHEHQSYRLPVRFVRSVAV